MKLLVILYLLCPRDEIDISQYAAKTNPLADIGIDFDAINRTEKRMEKPKPAATSPVSTTTMGKAIGSGSGIGRAGAGALRPPPNQMMGSGMGMGMGMGTGHTMVQRRGIDHRLGES